MCIPVIAAMIVYAASCGVILGEIVSVEVEPVVPQKTVVGAFYTALAGLGEIGDEQTTIFYNPATGELAVDAPANTNLTSINIDSAAAIFTGEPAMNLGGSFDIDSDDNIFKATFGSSFGSLSFGNVAQPGLSAEFILGDLTVIGSLAGGGDLGAVDLCCVPEPSTLVLLTLGIVTAVTLQRRN
jgi:hypothetical protein